MFERVLKTFGMVAIVLLICNFADGVFHGSRALPSFFFRQQDLAILAGLLVLEIALRRIPRLPDGLGKLAGRWAASPVFTALAQPRRPLVAVVALAVACGVIGWIGTGLVFGGYALSTDEVMANFDAAILAHGELMAKVAPAWRGNLSALAPQFVFHPDGGAFWMSSYLPVNAGLRALGVMIGARDWVSPVLATISVIAVFGVGRRLWPDRPQIAWFAAILLATSSQMLITAMTPYAMTAHLAFDLVWLWLFLTNRWWSHAGAIVVGAAACGLHQLIFHPLFVAPFIAQLWLDRRWRLAALYTLAYAGVCLFWVDYVSYALKTVTDVVAATPGGKPQGGLAWVIVTLRLLLSDFNLAAIGLTAKNLIRYVTWQNVLTTPLLVLGAMAAIRAKGVPRALLIGIVITNIATFVLMAYQGHGWGYRYMHGLLGSACLLAAWTWATLSERLDAPGKAKAQVVFLTVAALCVLVLLPVRAWQAHRFARPYATAYAELQNAKTPIVIVDSTGVRFGADLVRNDPYLTNRPLIFDPGLLDMKRLGDLCARYPVTLFDHRDAVRLGLQTFVPAPSRHPLDFERIMADLKCRVTESGH